MTKALNLPLCAAVLLASCLMQAAYAVDCSSKLVSAQTGPSSDCSGGNSHFWPIDYESSGCHGWRAEAPDGELHDNSANDMRCNTDGSFSFMQFAGTLVCDGSGTEKSIVLGECHQDKPPTLYTKGTENSCCTDPTSSGCVTDVPYVTQAGATIYLNGELCDASSEGGSSPSAESTPPPPTTASESGGERVLIGSCSLILIGFWTLLT
ncbi:hypothetical protein CYMTET_22616 [Cymbomonas tetramitiformis]|uniref:Uncharacterized protein n=1 Tax=Cymbomonas tetramitiformis TaxID=36881 RepID=A0AAE0L1Y1_9CHLO|nr:hypothetical protein CYMTET_22616 [Cymbomonas tetramitiformis]